MQKLPERLRAKLDLRAAENGLRKLPVSSGLIDFSSNDYLGFARNSTLYSNTFQLLLKRDIYQSGATGSRLLTGNHELFGELEDYLAKFHQVESALVFNSGYDANVGFFACVPQRGDVVFYDEMIHASIRDGLTMGKAKSHKFAHNDLEDLVAGIERSRKAEGLEGEIYVVTESVFSMDGDSPQLKNLVSLCKEHQCHLIVDEAHAIGVLGKNGMGLAQELGVQDHIFARIVTFGKALGSHGAAVLGSADLKAYLVNYARSLIYSTALPPHTIATVISAYQFMETPEGQTQRGVLQENIDFFKGRLQAMKLEKKFVPSHTAIQCCLVAGNDRARTLSEELRNNGFDVKPILSPTVPEGGERLRFCIHCFNSKEEIGLVLQLLSSYL